MLHCQQIDVLDQTCWAELQSTPIKDFTIAPDTWSTVISTQKMYGNTDDGGVRFVKEEQVTHTHTNMEKMLTAAEENSILLKVEALLMHQ